MIVSEKEAEDTAKLFHETYERLAPLHGYETRKESAVPWDKVPWKNKSLMIAVCYEILVVLKGGMMEQADLEKRFTYHAPKSGQPEIYTTISEQALGLARTLEAFCPESREKSLAVTKLEEAVMWANAAIARHG